MNDITNLLFQQLGQSALEQIAGRAGTPGEQTQGLIGMAVPLLMGALAKNAATPDGAQALHQALQNDNHASVLDDLTGFLGGTNSSRAANGAGILQHLLGGQQQAVSEQLAQKTGMDSGAALQILQQVAPLVLGAVAKTQLSQNLDASGLAGMLVQQQSQAQQAQPGLMGAISSMLDRDHDGSAMDDVLSMAMNFMRR